MDRFTQDLRHALRMLVKTPVFTTGGGAIALATPLQHQLVGSARTPLARWPACCRHCAPRAWTRW